MSHYDRDMKYLNDKRIIYRRTPTTDKPTATYEWGDFYEYGTHEYYALFQSKAKITTYRSLLWHLIVLWYLNLDLTQDEFKEVAWHMSQKENGFVTFKLAVQIIRSIRMQHVSLQFLFLLHDYIMIFSLDSSALSNGFT